MNIVKATSSHVEQVAFMFDHYRVFYGQKSDISRAKAFISERLANDDSVIFMSVDKEGNCLGFIQLYPSFSSVSTQGVWILNDLYVDINQRKKGIARKLLRHANQFAQETNAKAVLLETATDNINAQKLYESEGYVKSDGVFHYSQPVSLR